MAKIKPIFTTLFLLLFCTAINAQTRAVLTWEVLKYDITATLPQDFSADRDLDVKATLNLKNIKNRGFSRATLRLSDQAVVSSVQVNGATADFRKGEEKIGGNRKLQRVIVGMPSVPSGGTVSIIVNYKLNVKANSGLNALSPIGSQMLPLAHWYPTPTSWYFSGGGDYAPVSIKVNSVGNITVVSSGTKSANGFELKLNGQPFFITGNWDSTTAKGIEVYSPKGTVGNKEIVDDLATLASEAKNFTISLLGKSFETPIRIVGVNRGSGFSDSGTIFVDESVFNRQKLDSQTAMNVIEGVVKVWLGSLTKVEGDAYGVIREGLTRYIATQFLEKKYGKEVADLERLRQRTKYSAISTRDAPLNVLSPIDGYYYTATANKGAMIWNFLSNTYKNDFYKIVQAQAENGELNLRELRTAFSGQKTYLDTMIEQVTQTNLMIGLPQQNGSQTKVALRNLGSIDVDVEIVATTANGQKLTNSISIKANSFNETIFNTTNKIIRVEVDAGKVYPQTDYSDDIAPREIGENDALVFIKREFDRQKFEAAERNAKAVLKIYPNFDDARILLGRSQLAQNKTADAKKNFQGVLNLKLPSSQSISWAHVGLGEIAQKSGQSSIAKQHFEEAIKTDSELSATITARRNRTNLGKSQNIEASVKSFFQTFDKAVSENNKGGIDAMVLEGEISRFASSVAGQAQEWSTEVLQVDKIDANSILVETNMSVKLLNRQNESGTAVYRLVRVGNNWKLGGVEIFEVS